MKAQIGIEVSKLFACPECGSLEHSYGHLADGSTFGPWYCDECGCSVRGRVTGESVDIELHTERKINTLVLLRLREPLATGEQVHVVVKGMTFCAPGETPDFEHDVYFYEEHTCPWNWLRLPIKEDDDTDPHGLFVHQETVLMPQGYGDFSNHLDGIEQWRELFESLRADGAEVQS